MFVTTVGLAANEFLGEGRESIEAGINEIEIA